MVTYLIDRARIAAASEDYVLAYDDLKKANGLNPGRLDIFLLLASAARHIEKYDEAQAALDTYLKVYSDDAAAQLELGNLRHVRGDVHGARQAWLQVLLLADAGPSAEAARTNLERIDVQTEK